MKKVTVSLAISATLLLTACGGGSTSTTTGSNNKVYMPHPSTTTGQDDLWETDGTVSGTSMAHDFSVDYPSNTYTTVKLSSFITKQDRIYYDVRIKQTSALFDELKLFSTDTGTGNNNATQAVSSVSYGIINALNHRNKTWFNIVNDDLYITNDGTTFVAKISKIDALGNVTDVSPNVSTVIWATSDSVQIGDNIYYSGKSSTNDLIGYLVILDTTTDTYTYKMLPLDIPNTGSDTVNANKMFVMGNDIYFQASHVNSSTNGAELYRYETVGNSFTKVNAFNNVSEAMIDEGIVVGNKIYYFTQPLGGSSISGKLRVYDAASNTHLVLNSSAAFASNFVEHNNEVFFNESFTGAGLTPLWKTDGTVAGTKQLTDNTGNLVKGVNYSFALANGELYFSGTLTNSNMELWRYDSSTGFANEVMDIEPGVTSSNPSHITELNGGIVFQATQNSQRKLFNLSGATLTPLN